ncbi:FMN-linked oxidoreductase [Agrocybe pediades]|nr:FMN-linked oxidoreductase [Agrocybe pediades]
MRNVANLNVPAEGIPYFTPAQIPPAGTAIDGQPNGKEIPIIFQPIRIRGVQFQNRIWLSPLCQYSAQDGFITAWHMAHLGGIFTRGPGHTMVEASAVLANGRITPNDVGIWSDDHIKLLSELVTFAHSQSQKIGIQLAHAGRKASTVAPWINGGPMASNEVGGWPDDVWGPSDIPFDEDYPKPKALTKAGIQEIVDAFAAAAQRAVKAGFDVVEIHSAHGYLLHSFLSPVSNTRTDEYGGSFDNRLRIVLEVVDRVRSAIPDTMPLFLRISATDWLEESLPDDASWRSEDTVRLARILYVHGVDFLDISSGGNSPLQNIHVGPSYQVPFAKDVMRSLGAATPYPPATNTTDVDPPTRLIVGTVGAITSGKQAEGLLNDGAADVVSVGRCFQKNPGMLWEWAEALGTTIQIAHQISWGFKWKGQA